MRNVALLLLFNAIQGLCQQVLITRNQWIRTDTQRITAELFLTRNKGNNELAACILSAKIEKESLNYHTEVITSSDQGNNWKSLISGPFGEAADPWCIYSKDALIIADISSGNDFHLQTVSIQNNNENRQVVTHGMGHDHVVLTTVNNALIVTSTISTDSTSSVYLAVSHDQGRSFNDIHYRPFGNLGINVKTPTPGSAGRLYIPFITRMKYLKDGPEKMLNEYYSWLIHTDDLGTTFSNPRLITTISGNRHHYLEFSKQDSSLNYFFTGLGDKGVYYQKSYTQGYTWSEPVRIDSNQSTWVTPGAMAISENGTIVLIWNERIRDNTYQKYVAASIDGGISFNKPVQLQDATSSPDSSNDWVGRAWPQGGDYCGLVSLDDGRFYAMWSDARSGRFQLYASIITVR